MGKKLLIILASLFFLGSITYLSSLSFRLRLQSQVLSTTDGVTPTPDGSCNEPAAGCGDFWHWNFNTCTCEPDDTSGSNQCEPPSSGCGENHYWDFNFCSCVFDEEISDCQEPTTGCGDFYYWDVGSCSCVYQEQLQTSDTTDSTDTNTDSQPSPSEETTVTETTQVSYSDRLAQIDESTLSCIRNRLTSYELERLRYLVPKNEQEEEELRNIKTKAKVCFYSYSEIKQIGSATEEVGKLPEEEEDCLREILGEDVFNKINDGLRDPTQDELRSAKVCFAELVPSTIVYQSRNDTLSGDVQICLDLSLGESLDQALIRKTLTSVEERESAERCFGADPHPVAGRPVYQIPQSVGACLDDSLGQKYGEVIKGLVEISDEEKRDAVACFENLNEIQKVVLPKPPEMVPFLDESDEVRVFTVGEKLSYIEGDKLNKTLVISGHGPANTLIDIYIYSEPIVVTTKTDENGDWVYEMNSPLEGETHRVYAVASDSKGESVRSAVFNFQVVAAEDTNAGRLLEEEQSQATSRFLIYSLIFIGMTVVVVTLLMLYGYGGLMKTIEKKSDDSSSRNRESKA